MTRPKVFLDADIIHKLYLRMLLLSLDSGNYLKVRWSERVLKEALTSIDNRYPGAGKKLKPKFQMYAKEFPNSLVENYDHLIGTLGCRGVSDEHVLAAALTGECDFLLTFNLRDFPTAPIGDHPLKVLHPDIFLVFLLESNRDSGLPTITKWMSFFRNPELTIDEFSQALSKSGCPLTGSWLVDSMDR